VATLLWLTAAERAQRMPGVLSRGLSPSGEAVVWSVRPDETPDAQETIYTLALGAAANAPTTVVAGGSRWRVTEDGTAILFIRPPPNDPRAATGPLYVADFPSGGNPRLLADDVRQHWPAHVTPGTNGAVTLGGAAVGPLQLFADVGASPPSPVLLDSNVRQVENFDAARTRLVYSKAASGELHDLYSVSLSSPAQPCAFGTATRAGWPVFSSSGRYVAFSWQDDAQSPYRLLMGDLDTCNTAGPSPLAGWYHRLPGDHFLIAGEGLPLGRHGSAKLSLFGPGTSGTLGTVQLAEAVASPAGAAFKSDAPTGAVLYTVSHGWRTDGLYVLPKNLPP